MTKERAYFRPGLAVAAALLLGLPCTADAEAAAEPVRLGALLAEAESNHPELKALAARREAASTVPSQVKAMPDPLLTVAYTNEGFNSLTLGDSPDSSLVFTWTQDVPYPGKRGLAEDVARGEVTSVERELDAARVRILSRVKLLYFDLYRIDRTNDVLVETLKVLASFVASSRARYESGEGTLENVLKAQTELTAIDAEVTMNREDRRSVEARLAAAVGRGSAASFGPVTELPPAEAPELSALEAHAITNAPEIRLLEATAATESRRLDLARKNEKPDLMYGAAYSNRGGLDPMIMGMFGVRLPLYRGRKQAQAVGQSEYNLEASQRDLDRGKNEITARVRELFARFERASALEPLYAEGLIPQARSTLDAAAGSYAAGKIDFLSLLDAALKILRYEIEYERQRVDALQALAGLEETTGIELIQPPTGDLHE